MPEEGMQWQERSNLLTFEEIERVARIMVERYGVDGIRLTGGEPLVRARLPLLVEKLAALGVDLAMTTNGVSLPLVAAELKAAGLTRVNVSLDSFKRDRFLELTRRDDLDRVLAGVDAALEVGFDPVKINCVVMKGINDDEVLDFAEFGRKKGVLVRFIEFMPLDAEGHWMNGNVVGQAEIVEKISAEYPVEVLPARGAAPADRFRFLDGGLHGEGSPGSMIGVIPTVTKPFCGDCDRVRLTAEGDFRTCLFATKEFDLLTALRSGESDDQVADRIEAAVATKWAGHQNQPGQLHPALEIDVAAGWLTPAAACAGSTDCVVELEVPGMLARLGHARGNPRYVRSVKA